jgi:hypothetical protein
MNKSTPGTSKRSKHEGLQKEKLSTENIKITLGIAQYKSERITLKVGYHQPSVVPSL